MIAKLSRKDIKMLESSAKNNVSKSALEEYLSAHKKAETAWKVFRDSLVLSKGSGEDNFSKEVKSEKKRKFKAGDKVRVLDTSSPLTASFLRVGDITKVVDYKEDQGRKWSNPQQRPVVVEDFISKSNGYFEETALELVEEGKPQRKFKVGDTVRVLSAIYPLAYGEDFSVGNVGTVVGYKGKEIPWDNDTKDSRPVVVTNHSCNCWGHFEESALRLVTEEEKLPNELRAGIIQRAKEFVEEYADYPLLDSVIQISEQRKKRKIVASIVSIKNMQFMMKEVVVKTHPDDVYNFHIGKAIAIGRLLDKDVTEFENAVQPTKVVQGQVIAWKLDEEKALYRIDNKTGIQFNFTEVKSNEKHHIYEYREIEKYTNIVDDTNAQYGIGDE